MAFDISQLTSFIKTGIPLPENGGIIGVDVGSSAIKIVELRNNKGVPTLTTYGELQLGPYENADIGMTMRPQLAKLTEAFVDILREASANGKRIALSVPYTSSFTTIIAIPTADTKMISGMIPVEAKKYVPVPLNEVSLDWFPVSNRSKNHETKILLAAIYNDALNRYRGMVQGAALTTLFSEIEIFSTIRSVVSREDETVAIIDLGAGSTKLFIVHKGGVGTTYSIPLSGSELTRNIAKTLNIEFKVAEERKRAALMSGVTTDDPIYKVLISAFDRGFRELYRVMQRFSEEEEKTIGKIILTGGGALLSGLQTYVQDLSSIRTEIADPFSKVAYPAFLEDTLREAGPSFSVAIGAALRGLMTNE